MEHSHEHHSHTEPKDITKAFIVGLILNTAFVVIEAIAGLYTHSLSVLALRSSFIYISTAAPMSN